MDSTVRVRFAPSPTGDPHVGNIRTAIFNWLFARHHGGSFVLRVEDTDKARRVEGATEQLLRSLDWLGLDWDEGPHRGGSYGPYYQSERLELYRQVTEELLKQGNAYHCYCTPDRLKEMRVEQDKQQRNLGYDRRCRNLSEFERMDLERSVSNSVIRFKMPADGMTTLDDLIKGSVSFENHLLDDFVMLKSDGYPTYHLANVVDDHYMKISHVLRAEEWLPSSPRHLRLYDALAWTPPQFAHLPIILAPDRSKLSKRHGATSVLDYRKMGYLPQVMVNFLALLGWSLDDKTEIISIEELIRYFSIDRIGKSGAVFSSEKLTWMNGHWIRQLSYRELADALFKYWGRYPPQEIPTLPEKNQLLRIVPLIQERLKSLSEAAPLIHFFFKGGIEYHASDLIQNGMDADKTREALQAMLTELSSLECFDAESIERALRPLAQELNLKTRQLFGSLRVATTGLRVAPPLFQSIEILGKARTEASIKSAIARL